MSAITRRGLIIFGVIVVIGAVLCYWLPFRLLPSIGLGVGLPSISLAPEVLKPNFFLGIDLSNSFTSLLVVDIIVLLIAWRVRRAVLAQPPERYVPRGLVNFIELLAEFWHNQARNVLGEYTGRVLPLALTIFLFIVIANWMELIPGVESVGLITCAEQGKVGYALNGPDQATGPFLNVSSLDLRGRAGKTATKADADACEHKYNGENGAMDYRPPKVTAEGASTGTAEGGTTGAAEGGTSGTQAAAAPNPNLFNVIPFFRPVTTDLNFTLALALIVFIGVQVWGVWALKGPYFYKFINVRALGNAGKRPMGLMDFLVGLVDIISELSRLISLSFRLLGNIFAGGVLLSVMGFLVAFMLPIVFYGLELFVGVIQAYVFAILTVMYASQAVFAHHGEEEHDEPAHAEPVEQVVDLA